MNFSVDAARVSSYDIVEAEFVEQAHEYPLASTSSWVSQIKALAAVEVVSGLQGADIKRAVLSADHRVYSCFCALPDQTLLYLKATGSGDGTSIYVRLVSKSGDVMALAAKVRQITAKFPSVTPEETESIVSFWFSTKQHGPDSVTRRIATSPWNEIEKNYSSEIRSVMSSLIANGPSGGAGNLVLWHGPPGTGKTYALRSLIHEWKNSAHAICITDPEQFFGSSEYMLNVMLAEHDDDIAPSYEYTSALEMIETTTGTEVVPVDPVKKTKEPKWKLVIVEDAGEMLGMTAKADTGQSLSRLLNLSDGLIGQGLRALVLITTNEEIGKLHPAVMRPGRCRAEMEFSQLSVEDGLAWLNDHGAAGKRLTEPKTLAELYDLATPKKLRRKAPNKLSAGFKP